MSIATTGTGHRYIFRAGTVRMHTEADLKGDQEMKFYVGRDKKNGEKLREIVKLEAKKKPKGYISVETVKHLIGTGKTSLIEERYYGWSCEDVRKKMRLRQTKEGWFLYFPKTMDLPFGDSFSNMTINFEEKPERVVDNNPKIADIFAKELDLRLCRVISKKKNTVIEEFGFFHRWFHSRMPNSDGEFIEQELAIIEFKDGSVRQIRPDHIIFGWEE